MGRRVKIPEAAKITGLSEYAIYKGVRQGWFPHIRTSGDRGRIFIDIELLEEQLEREAQSNAGNRSEPPMEK